MSQGVQIEMARAADMTEEDVARVLQCLVEWGWRRVKRASTRLTSEIPKGYGVENQENPLDSSCTDGNMGK